MGNVSGGDAGDVFYCGGFIGLGRNRQRGIKNGIGHLWQLPAVWFSAAAFLTAAFRTYAIDHVAAVIVMDSEGQQLADWQKEAVRGSRLS